MGSTVGCSLGGKQANISQASTIAEPRRPWDQTGPKSLGSSPILAISDRQRLSDALDAVGRGDRRALGVVYQQTSAKLFGICLRILGEQSEAEDVLQDVYLTVWRRAGSFDPARGVSPITWLAALARNRAIDRLRASKTHLNRPLESAEEMADGAPLASEGLLQAEAGRRLADCLAQLAPQHAAYIRAAYFDGLTYAELAEQTETPLGTIKSWMRRSLIRLRTCMNHE
jgi:RNA polymerase sigma factor (sigma-70 family)